MPGSIVVNRFRGGGREFDLEVSFSLCTLRDPDLKNLLPREKGFEVLTVKDGGRRICWSRNNFDQMREAKERFLELVNEGLVPYYIDPGTGKASELPMSTFDPLAEEVTFERADYDPSQVLIAPTRAAVGG